MADIVKLTVSVISEILRNDSSDSDSSSNEEWESLLKEKERRIIRPRIQGYAECVVARYTNYDFQHHFRLQRATFEYILSVIEKDFVRKTTDCEMIPFRQQCLIALWKMAMMDSYRYVSSHSMHFKLSELLTNS
ncbi:uncharacterized protein LOC105282198 [Ooceraea biroi]|uniref:uncharacterized protein LOC105282198 n=1 Tax=Ooceraea biroi TaxID=2015173 RepID=UPI000F089670|nr:uncharacterized protein LOC105282198 [Ooceraea biroi]